MSGTYIPRYRAVQAWQFTPEELPDAPGWVQDAIRSGPIVIKPGEWMVTDGDEVIVMSDATFRKTYEPAPEPSL